MKYTVSATVTVSCYTEVEANSPEDALEKAELRDMQSLCHSCSSSQQPDEEWSLSGELDGCPQDLRIDP